MGLLTDLLTALTRSATFPLLVVAVPMGKAPVVPPAAPLLPPPSPRGRFPAKFALTLDDVRPWKPRSARHH
eukprot:9521945-Lingulodinium_polyedra.AAC.1